jgi:hypothetical protein
MERIVAVRMDYIGAAIAMAVLAGAALSGGTAAALVASDHGRSVPPMILSLFTYVPGLFGFAGIALFLYFAIRPHWLGKVFCVWAGIGWIGYAVVADKIEASNIATLSIGAAGILMLVCAIVRWTVAIPATGRRA